jgi:hypothetical protein
VITKKRKDTEMKKNAVMFFLKSLLKSIVVIVSILAVGVISYKVSYEYLSKQLEEGKLDVKEQELENILDQAQTDEISKNLIYVVDNNQKITHLMLEICNTQTYNMDYITIPVATDYTIPSKMYQKLCVVDEEIPQIVRLSKLRKYFSDLEDSKAYGYAELIIEKMLDVDISYFTVISSDIYKNHYQLQEQTTTYTKVSQETESATQSPESSGDVQTGKSSVTMRVNVISDSYKNQLADLSSDENKIMDFIKEQYEQDGLVSNLTVYNKIGYLEAYQKMDTAYYHYWGIPGEYTGKLFTVDTASASGFIKKIQNRKKTYTEEQSFGKTVSKKKQISSKGKKILLLNGSKISGLAASKQTTLTQAGFTVPKVGDYTREVLTQTRIIVPKKRMGNDLAQYFKNPEIVVGEVESGYDIEIILGTVDAN